MRSIQAIVEGKVPEPKDLAPAEEAGGSQPSYTGSAPLVLQIAFATANGWGGVIKIGTSTHRITSGVYGVQKLALGLTIPIGVTRGKWEWDGKRNEGSDPKKMSVDRIRKIVESEIPTSEIVFAALSEIEKELGELHLRMQENGDSEIRWRELFSASSALQWVRDSTGVAQPSVAIGRRDAARSHYLSTVANF